MVKSLPGGRSAPSADQEVSGDGLDPEEPGKNNLGRLQDHYVIFT